MTYSESISYLHHTPRFPNVPSLDRIKILMELLGDPQDTLRFIHIAGTNGKGSTAAMTASILSEAGYRTGLFTSPYLERFEERMRVNGVPITKDLLCKHVSEIKEAVEQMQSFGKQPTEFELVTALGFLFFKDENCDFVILETGLGGRFDATNVIKAPIASAITSISRDHTQVLGETLTQIASEKCGILKTGSYAVTTYSQKPEVYEVIENCCKEKHIPLVIPKPPSSDQILTNRTGTQFLWNQVFYTIPLLGLHQVENALLALQMIQFIRESGFPVSKEAERKGLASVVWPGRLELITQNPMILLDTAHNPGGIKTLCKALDTYFPDKTIHTIMGMLSDKEYEACIEDIAKRSERFYAVAPPIPSRAISEALLGDVARSFCRNVEVGMPLAVVIQREVELLKEKEMLLICGSIPLVGAARSLLH